MPEFDNEMTFVLFDQKDTAGNKPQYRGQATIGGIEYKLSGWRKTSKAGATFISGSIQTPEEAAKYQKKSVEQEADARSAHTIDGEYTEVSDGMAQDEDDLDDEIPF